MNQKKDNEKLYKSPSTGQMCDCAQYIAELMCSRNAAKNKVSGLEYKFWNKSRKDEFVSQVVAARRLIDKFGEKLILSFILTDGSYIYSLGKFNTPKFILDKIQQFKKKFDQQIIEPIEDTTETVTVQSKVRTGINKTGLFSKIKRAEDTNG